MRLLLIRHGETVHNVAGVYAGVTDSALTNHGVLQANRLGSYLVTAGFRVSHIFSSDLRRAYLTAEAIREPQSPEPPPITKLQLLREQDFGSYEGKQFMEKQKEPNKSGKEVHRDINRDGPGFKDVESKENMRLRMETFINQYLVNLFYEVGDNHTVAVVAHGIILSHLWRTLLKRFNPGNVSVSPSVQSAIQGFSLEHLGMWLNTGYLDLEIRRISIAVIKDITLKDTVSAAATKSSITLPGTSSLEMSKGSHAQMNTTTSKSTISTSSTLSSSRFTNLSLMVKAVNSQEHLKGLKRTRGGIGSLKHDSSQKTMDSFFKKRKLS